MSSDMCVQPCNVVKTRVMILFTDELGCWLRLPGFTTILEELQVDQPDRVTRFAVRIHAAGSVECERCDWKLLEEKL